MIGWNIYAKGRTRGDGNSSRVLGVFFSLGLTGLFKMPASNSSAEETTFLDCKLQKKKKKLRRSSRHAINMEGPENVPEYDTVGKVLNTQTW